MESHAEIWKELNDRDRYNALIRMSLFPRHGYLTMGANHTWLAMPPLNLLKYCTCYVCSIVRQLAPGVS